MATTETKMKTLEAALVAAQSELPEIPKDGTGTVRGVSKKTGKSYEYEYKYATLPTIFRLVMPVLHKHKLALTQTSRDGCLVTALRHESGACLESTLEMPSPLNMSPQDYGSAHSYYRRYEVNGMLGLAPDDDLDADGVGAPAAPPDNPPPDDDADEKYIKATNDLIKRGAVALYTIGSHDDPEAEMDTRLQTALSHYDAKTRLDITDKSVRLKFYRDLESTVKQLEADAAGVDEAGI